MRSERAGLTDSEWDMLESICQDWLDSRVGEPEWPEAEALARRIIAAAEAGRA